MSTYCSAINWGEGERPSVLQKELIGVTDIQVSNLFYMMYYEIRKNIKLREIKSGGKTHCSALNVSKHFSSFSLRASKLSDAVTW